MHFFKRILTKDHEFWYETEPGLSLSISIVLRTNKGELPAGIVMIIRSPGFSVNGAFLIRPLCYEDARNITQCNIFLKSIYHTHQELVQELMQLIQDFWYQQTKKPNEIYIPDTAAYYQQAYYVGELFNPYLVVDENTLLPIKVPIAKSMREFSTIDAAKKAHPEFFSQVSQCDLTNLQGYDLSTLTPGLKENIIEYIFNLSLPTSKQQQLLKHFIAKGADYSHFFVTLQGSLDQIKALVSAGADINIHYHYSTVLNAVLLRSNKKEWFTFLFQHGANINYCEKIYDHGTALHVMIANENFDDCIDLIRLNRQYAAIKIDYQTKDNEGKSPLIIAAKMMSLEIVQELLKDGASSIDLQDNEGRSALHYACALGQTKMVELLIKAGANTNIKDPQGRGIIHYALLPKSEIRKILLSIHLDPDRNSNADRNAFYSGAGAALSIRATGSICFLWAIGVVTERGGGGLAVARVGRRARSARSDVLPGGSTHDQSPPVACQR